MATVRTVEVTCRFRWVILVLLLFLQTGASLVILSFGPLAPFLQEELNISRAQMGLFTSVVYTGTILFGALCGWLVDRFGIRRFLLLGPGIIGLFFIALANAPSYGIALILVFLGGLGYVFINPSAAKALTYWFSPETRATAIGLMKTGVPLGSAVGAAVLPSLALVLGWRNAVTVVALAVITIGILVTVLYRESPIRTPLEAQAFGLREFRRVLTNRSILLVGGMGITYTAIQLTVSTYLVLFLKEAVLLPVVIAGTYLTVAALSGAVGRVLWGIISDRVFGGKRKAVLIIIGLINATMLISITFWAAVLPWWPLYIMIAILGFACLGWNGIFITLLAEVGSKEQVGTAVGFGIAISGLGILFGPPLFGYIVDTTQSYATAWTVFGIGAVLGSSLVMLIREQK